MSYVYLSILFQRHCMRLSEDTWVVIFPINHIVVSCITKQIIVLYN